ncbi:MAG: penicillin-binding protein [Oscillospiraceae bacterium]|nr:penicillin-binding protein [Oscillospiraceae bacterium]
MDNQGENRPRSKYIDISSSSFQNKNNNSSRDISSSSAARTRMSVPRKSPKYKDISSSSGKSRNSRLNKKHSGNGKNGNRNKKGTGKARRIFTVATKIFLTLCLIFVITMSIVVTALTVYVMRFLEDDDSVTIEDAKLHSTTLIFATNKKTNEPEEIRRITRRENRIWVDLDDIPAHVQHAFVVTEDERFRDHEGVDWRRTAGAFLNMFFNFWDTAAGGSTITQQVIKNITDEWASEGFQGIERKVKEIFRAMNFERRYSKDQILELYLNIIHMGRNTGGVQAASQLYFGKNVNEIDEVEAAALAAMTKNPTGYNVYDFPERNKNRREYVLRKMREFNVITGPQYRKFIKRDPKLRDLEKEKFAAAGNKGGVQNYFVDHVIQEVIEDLSQELGCTKKTAEAMLYNGGYRIYTTIDQSLQKKLESKFRDNSVFSSGDLSGRKDRNGNTVGAPQAAMVIFDHNGALQAVVGGKGRKRQSGIFNRATQAQRKMGSTVKPIAVYAPAIQNDLITYSTILSDNPPYDMVINGVRRKWPNNYGNKKHGPLTVVQAIQRSTNTAPAQVLKDMLTEESSFNFMRSNFFFDSLVIKGENDVDNNGNLIITDDGPEALVLGDFHRGVKLYQFTACFQMFANGGYYTRPHSYTKVVNTLGETVLSRENTTKRVMDESSAWIMNRLLLQVVEGANASARDAKLPGTEVIGKTGTSSNDYDWTFMGITPYYVTGFWTGYDTEIPLLGIGLYQQARQWRNIMSDLHGGLDKKEFTSSKSVIEARYCSSSGRLSNSGCPGKFQGYYKESNLPGQCTQH